ncbi:hypothetical protein U1Q18_047391 [Sarracenia purpurea var. burkii]
MNREKILETVASRWHIEREPFRLRRWRNRRHLIDAERTASVKVLWLHCCYVLCVCTCWFEVIVHAFPRRPPGGPTKSHHH